MRSQQRVATNISKRVRQTIPSERKWAGLRDYTYTYIAVNQVLSVLAIGVEYCVVTVRRALGLARFEIVASHANLSTFA